MTTRGWLLFAAMGVIWGIPYLLIKIAVAEVEPAVLVFGRTAIGTLLLLPIAVARSNVRALLPHWRLLVVYTLVEVIGPWLLLSHAETRLSSSLAGLLIGVGLVVGFNVAADDLVAVGEVGLVVLGYAIGAMLIARMRDVPNIAVIAGSLAVAALTYLPIAIAQWPSHAP